MMQLTEKVLTSTSRAPDVALLKHPLLVVLVLGFSSLNASIMQSLVIPIQGELPKLLNTTPSNASWVVTATLLGGAVAMPVAGKLADMFGKKRVLVTSACVLLAGSLLCAVAEPLLLILLGRVLQGLAMGYVPVAISMVREVTPPQMANWAMAMVSATLGVGGSLGLPLSAWIAERFEWRTLFWVAAAMAAAVIVTSLLFLPNIPTSERGRLDVVGAIGLTLGLISLLIGITKGNDWGWGTLRTWALILGGLLVLVLWGYYQTRREDPLVDLRTSTRLPVLFTNLAAVTVGFGMMGTAIVIPQLLQMTERTGYGLGQTLLQTGLWMAPGGLMMILCAPVSSILLTRIGARITLALGAGVLATGYVVAFFFNDEPWTMLLVSCICSAGVGIGYAAMPTLILDNVPPAKASSSVGVNSLMRSIGTTIAGAVMTLVLTGWTMQLADGVVLPSAMAFQLCFLVGAAAAIATVGLGLLVPRQARRTGSTDVGA